MYLFGKQLATDCIWDHLLRVQHLIVFGDLNIVLFIRFGRYSMLLFRWKLSTDSVLLASCVFWTDVVIIGGACVWIYWYSFFFQSISKYTRPKFTHDSSWLNFLLKFVWNWVLFGTFYFGVFFFVTFAVSIIVGNSLEIWSKLNRTEKTSWTEQKKKSTK